MTKWVVGVVLTALTATAVWAASNVVVTQKDNTRRINVLEQQSAVNSAEHAEILRILGRIEADLREERQGRRRR